MMRVTYVCADAGVPVYGSKGCSIHVQEIVRSFLRRGDHVDLYATRTGGEKPFDWKRFQLFDFRLGQCADVKEREMQQWSNAYRIAEEIEKISSDLVYERYSLWSDATMNMAQERGIPSILEVNAPLIEEQKKHRDLVHQKEAESIRDQAFAAASTIVAVSEGVAQYVRRYLRSEEHSKVFVIPNGVDIDRFRPPDSPVVQERPFTVGFLGTLKPWHGIESLMQAFERVHAILPTARLRLIGEGPLRATLEQKLEVENRSLHGQIDWIGAVVPQAVPEQLAQLDVAVAPYPTSEEFYFSPLKVYEYMSMGCAVVASNVGQLSDVLIDRLNGRLYPPGDAHSLAAILLELAEDRGQREVLGRNARQAMVAGHSWSHTLERILSSAFASQSSAARLSFPGDINRPSLQRFGGKVLKG